MRDFILIDFLIEKVNKLFSLLENHTHDNLYVKKEDLEVETFIKQTPNRITFDYRIKDGNNAILSGPIEISSGTTLEVPKGSVLSII
jgi:hypothetical protein